MKPNNYTQDRKLICYLTDEKNFLILCRMLKLYVRHGRIVEKVHEVISFKQSKWLEKYINLNTQKLNQTKKDCETDFYNLLKNLFHGKTKENVRFRTKMEVIKTDDIEKIITQQTKLSFKGFQKPYTNCDCYTFEENEVLMDKPSCLGFAVLKLSQLLMFQTYNNKLQTFFEEKFLQLHYMDFESFILSIYSFIIIKDLQYLDDFFDFNNLIKNH